MNLGDYILLKIGFLLAVLLGAIFSGSIFGAQYTTTAQVNAYIAPAPQVNPLQVVGAIPMPALHQPIFLPWRIRARRAIAENKGPACLLCAAVCCASWGLGIVFWRLAYSGDG